MKTKTLQIMLGAIILTALTVGNLFAQFSPDSEGNIFINIAEGVTYHEGAGTYAANTPWEIKEDATAPYGSVLVPTGDNLEAEADDPASPNYGTSVSYEFNATAESFFTWVLLKAPSTSNGRLFISINDHCIDDRSTETFDPVRPRIGAEGVWQWVKMGNNLESIMLEGTNTIRIYSYRNDIEIGGVIIAESEEVFPVLDKVSNIAVTSEDENTMTISWDEASKTGFVMEQDNNTERAYAPSFVVALNGAAITDEPTLEMPIQFTENSISINKSDMIEGDNVLSIQQMHFKRKNSSEDILGRSAKVDFTFAASEEEPIDAPDPHIADKNGVFVFSATAFFENKEGTGVDGPESWIQGSDEVIGDYMYLANTTDENRNEVSADRHLGPSLVYQIDVGEEAQKGFVWALVNEGGKDKGRIYVNVNDLCLDERAEGEFGDPAKSRISEQMQGQWQWILLKNQVNDAVKQAGINTIELFKSRPNIKIAKIAFTPEQKINMIIDQPTPYVAVNDGANLTIKWDEPTLTGELYGFDEVIIDPKSYFYTVKLGEMILGENISAREIQVAVTDLSEPMLLSVEVGHEFRKNSSSNFDSYSLPGVIQIEATSEGIEEEKEPIDVPDPHIADKNGVFVFSATAFFENKEGTGVDGTESWIQGSDEVIGDYMYLANTSDENRNEVSADRHLGPSLVYQIDVGEEAQKGFVWALVNEGGKDKGRIYVNVNDLCLDERAEGEFGDPAKSRISEQMQGQWQWILLNNQVNDAVKQAGINTIELFKSRPNIKIAKIAFTPEQKINMIIDQPTPMVSANDGTNITIAWEEPTLTGELYGFDEVIIDPKSYFYEVSLDGEVYAADITTRTIQIPIAELGEPSTLGLKVGHEFRKNSSSNLATFSLEGEINIDATTQPEGEVETDTEAPTTPLNLVASEITSNSITLTWEASSDNVGVAGYKIIQDGNELSVTVNDATTYTVEGLEAETMYTFAVKAYDTSGNISENSISVEVTTTEVVQNPEGDYQDIIHMADENGIYQFDAVDFVANLPGTDAFAGQKWLIDADEEVGRYIYIENTDTLNNSNRVSSERMKSPRISYQISMPEVQTGFLWALVQQGGKDAGEIYGNVNGIDVDKRTAGEYGSAFGSRISGDLVGQWQWILVGYQIRNNNGPMLKSGINEIEIFMAYPDIKIAKFIYAPKQEILPIINPAKLRIQSNDETTVTVSWDEPVLTGELYDNEPKIISPKDYTYRVKLEGKDEELIKERQYVINKSDLSGGKLLEVEIGHQFRKSSSSTALFYSMPSYLTVTAEDQADFEAPTQPMDLSAIDIQGTNVALSWTASEDNIGVLGYNIYQNGIKIQEVTSTSYKVSGLSTSTEYTFEVEAFDGAGNTSVKSNVLMVTTRDKDVELTDRPNQVEDLVATQITSSSFTLGWRPSNSLNGITAYYVFLRIKGIEEFDMIAQLNGETFSFDVENLTLNTEYEVMVRAEDGAGHLSEESEILEVITENQPLSIENDKVFLFQKVYPNPSTGIVNVDFSTNVEYTIYNLMGQKIISGSGQMLHLNLSKGTYILRAIDQNGASDSAKLICQ